MVTFDRIIGAVILISTFIYTVSYGIWTWKRKNKLGAVMVFLVAVAALVLPVYMVFFRQ